ncbi:MAG: ABC transporter ATP-binding protein [Stenomitos rutilans HA7619-LM2]|jgi:simple sugar transport system ATP-binding protein|nr:ABC transporter ATP-binding protein [Stenomitos rutilans HA7619-LM2]
MSHSTNAIFGKRALHQIFADDYIDWATELLVKGYDSPNLRILAGLDRRSSVFDIETYFIHAIKELDIEEPEPKAAIRAYACEIAQQIINGQFISLRQAIQPLYQIWLDTDHDPDYVIWLELDDALDSLYAGEFPYSYPSATLENIDAIVHQEAARFVNQLLQPEADVVLQLTNISKRFGSLLANDAVSLELHRGEVLALLGENGAGKTTLMNILFGHYVADQGSIAVFGKPLKTSSPRAAIEAGVGMVHQHFTLADNLSVLDNITLGTEPLWRPWQNLQAARQRLTALSDRFGLAVNSDAKIGALSVGERQRVEILKALYRDVKILILDEPTAVLTPPEAASLFATLRQLTSAGLSIVFISHKLQEVMAVSDRVIVLRAGKVVAAVTTADTTPAQLAEHMVGRPLPKTIRQPLTPGEPVLQLDRVTLKAGHLTSLDAINLLVRQQEIVGIAGVSGNGQAALFDLLSGLMAPTQGIVQLYGQKLQQFSPADMVQAGVARIPEDRHTTGLVTDMTIWENLILETHQDQAFSQIGLLKREAATRHAAGLIAAFDVRCPSPKATVRLLSGGNMQKLILGRELSRDPKLILASQPTRGLDLGAVTTVHQRLLEARANGAGVLLISEDLDELLTLSDRLYVLYKGRLSPSIAIENVVISEIGLMMAGKEGKG